MMMWTRIGLVAVALTVTSTAQANTFELLQWACEGGATYRAKAKAFLLEACKATEATDQKVCDEVDGTPFYCHNKEVKTPEEPHRCASQHIRMRITTENGLLGWKVVGVVYVTYTMSAEYEHQECETTMKPPPRVGGDGGTYVKTAGEAKLTVRFVADGTGHLTFLGGKVFGKKYDDECDDDLSVDIYTTDETVACETSWGDCSEEVSTPDGLGLECVTAP